MNTRPRQSTLPARMYGLLSLPTRLVLLVLVSIVPLLIFALGREYFYYQEARATAGQRALDFANSMSLVVEQALQNRIATSRILGLSRALHTGDIQTFRAQAEAFLNTTRFSGANLVLLKEDGQQLMNTFEPPGAVLPNRENLDSVKEVFATGEPVVSDLFLGTVQQRPVVSIEVPIKDEAGHVIYSLALIPRIGVFADTIRQHHPPEGWVIAVYDRQGVIVARTHQPEQYIGHKAQAAFLSYMLANHDGIVEVNTLEGIPVLSAFSHTAAYGWSVAVGVPVAELTAPAMRSALRTLAVGGVLLLASLLLAHVAARRISGPIASLTHLATASDDELAAGPATTTGLAEADAVAHALRTALDVRKRSEELSRENERRFRNLVEGSLLAILIHRHGMPLFVNQACASMLGCATADEVIARGAVDWALAPHEVARVRAARAARQAGNTGIVSHEVEARRKDGTPFWAYVQSRSVIWDGQPADQITMQDITERKRAEEQLRQAQKMEAVGQLTGGIAHDFNNILGVVVGNLDQQVELLQENAEATEFNDELKALGASALDAALRGAELVQRLLAFSRNQPLRPQPLDLGLVVRDVGPLVRRALGEQVKLKTRVPEGLWPVLADRTQTENAILNLAINARDAMPNGGRLTVICANAPLDEGAGAAAEITPGAYVTLSIVDTGSGIPPDILAKVFEPFFTTKEVGKGSGLGLSMVFGFARQSGGTVKIYSEVGNGTEVRIYLPSAKSPIPAEADTDAEEVPPAGQERILIVEDKIEVREIASKILRSLGYAVTQAADGAAAIDLLDRGMMPDLLFTDIVMPGKMSGIDVAREARRRFPDLSIIFTSGFSNPETIHSEAVSLGASLIGKPYRKIDLAKHIRAVLDRAKK